MSGALYLVKEAEREGEGEGEGLGQQGVQESKGGTTCRSIRRLIEHFPFTCRPRLLMLTGVISNCSDDLYHSNVVNFFSIIITSHFDFVESCNHHTNIYNNKLIGIKTIKQNERIINIVIRLVQLSVFRPTSSHCDCRYEWCTVPREGS